MDHGLQETFLPMFLRDFPIEELDYLVEHSAYLCQFQLILDGIDEGKSNLIEEFLPVEAIDVLRVSEYVGLFKRRALLVLAVAFGGEALFEAGVEDVLLEGDVLLPSG